MRQWCKLKLLNVGNGEQSNEPSFECMDGRNGNTATGPNGMWVRVKRSEHEGCQRIQTTQYHSSGEKLLAAIVDAADYMCAHSLCVRGCVLGWFVLQHRC